MLVKVQGNIPGRQATVEIRTSDVLVKCNDEELANELAKRGCDDLAQFEGDEVGLLKELERAGMPGDLTEPLWAYLDTPVITDITLQLWNRWVAAG